ncbi:hypothetical protein BKA80DRAFT_94463 [Phyllosticta citrichinensis]
MGDRWAKDEDRGGLAGQLCHRETCVAGVVLRSLFFPFDFWPSLLYIPPSAHLLSRRRSVCQPISKSNEYVSELLYCDAMNQPWPSLVVDYYIKPLAPSKSPLFSLTISLSLSRTACSTASFSSALPVCQTASTTDLRRGRGLSSRGRRASIHSFTPSIRPSSPYVQTTEQGTRTTKGSVLVHNHIAWVGGICKAGGHS